MQRVQVVDSHTGGEPTRVVVAGGPELGQGSAAEKMQVFRQKFDSFRSAVVSEPRGSNVLVGALLTEPADPSCVAGVIFFVNVGYLGMCGHGTIGLMVTLAHLGKLGPGEHRLETPVGVVTARLHETGDVSVQNVPAYRYAHRVPVMVEGYGEIVGDIAWGGNWFYLISEHGQELSLSHVDALTDFTLRIRQALEREGITGKDGQEIDHIELFAPSEKAGVDSRNFVLCPGKSYDRSPCGTGTSAKLACLYADGKLREGEVWRQESITGSVFEGSIQVEGNVLRPTIRGSAYVNAEATLLLNPMDTALHGHSVTFPLDFITVTLAGKGVWQEEYAGISTREQDRVTLIQDTTRKYDVITFGETMLRLSAPGFSRLEEAVSLDVRIGGSESNTAVALARLGLKVAWGSKLPANPLGRRIENEIRRWGVDTSHVLWDNTENARAGLYFLDFGVAPRGIDVYYDRRDSAITSVHLEEIDVEWTGDARLLHLSGITPALGENCAEVVRFLMQQARASGTKVSFDTNYRSKLWSPAEAKRGLERLLPLVDVLLTPLSDAEMVLGIGGDGPTVAKELRSRYGVSSAVVTCGGDGACACDDRGDWAATPFALTSIVDRVGAGDAFNAGVLMGCLQGDLNLGLEYGTAMAALKHTMPGDLLLSTRDEIENARTRGTGGIRR